MVRKGRKGKKGSRREWIQTEQETGDKMEEESVVGR
jgi:hypothetical protein